MRARRMRARAVPGAAGCAGGADGVRSDCAGGGSGTGGSGSGKSPGGRAAPGGGAAGGWGGREGGEGPAARRRDGAHAGRRGRFAALLVALAALSLLSLLAAGCSGNPAPEEPLRPFKVFVQEETYQMEYRDYFDAAFPGLQVEPVWLDEPYPTGPDVDFNALIAEAIEEKQPDLIIMNNDVVYRYLADQGMLGELSGWMERNGVREEDYHPGLFELLRHNEQGGVYAFAPTMDVDVLHYNQDLFERYGIDPPTEGMTWPDVLRLAERFAGEGGAEPDGTDGAPVVGYHTMYLEKPLGLIQQMSRTEGLAMLDPARRRMTMDTPAWRTVFRAAVDAFTSGAVVPKRIASETVDGVRWIGPEASADADLFGQGRAAMQVGSYPGRADAGFRRAAVTAPVSMTDPQRQDGMRFYPLFGVREGSDRREQALEAIRYFASEHFAVVRSKLTGVGYAMGELAVHRAYAERVNDPVVDAIFERLPVISPDRRDDYAALDRSFYEQLDAIVDRELEEALNGSQSAEEALSAIQTEGQALLDAPGGGDAGGAGDSGAGGVSGVGGAGGVGGVGGETG